MVKPERKKGYNLKDLVSKIKDENIHQEIDFGVKKGKEIRHEAQLCPTRGAILMAVSNSFRVFFQLICTREKAGKIKNYFKKFAPIVYKLWKDESVFKSSQKNQKG